MTDFAIVEWSPTRGVAIVRVVCDEVPPDEADEAAHQILSCGVLARRMNDHGKAVSVQTTDDLREAL